MRCPARRSLRNVGCYEFCGARCRWRTPSSGRRHNRHLRRGSVRGCASWGPECRRGYRGRQDRKARASKVRNAREWIDDGRFRSILALNAFLSILGQGSHTKKRADRQQSCRAQYSHGLSFHIHLIRCGTPICSLLAFEENVYHVIGHTSGRRGGSRWNGLKWWDYSGA